MSYRLAFRPEAAADVRAAVRWYEARRPGLGQEFEAALEADLALLREAPTAFPVVHRELRKLLLRRFPYTLYFRIEAGDLVRVHPCCTSGSIRGAGVGAREQPGPSLALRPAPSFTLACPPPATPGACMRFAGLTLALLVVAPIAPIHAQDAPARASTVASAAEADTAPSPDEMAAARTLIELVRLEETALAAGMQAFDQQAAATPGAAEFRDVVEAWMREVFGSEEARTAFARAYADALTEEELTGLVAFYRSPLGARLAVLQPTLAAKGAVIGQQLAEARRAELEGRIMARAAALEGAATE